MWFLYFLALIVIGVFLNVLRGYDLFTISLIYVLLSVVWLLTNIYVVIYIFVFFVLAEGITFIFNKKHGKRNYNNLLGNTLACILFLVIGFVLSEKLNILNFAMFSLASIVSINVALSDTFSSEIGNLSRKRPRLITTFEKVDKGVGGGITFLGVFAAAFASFLSCVYFYFIGYEYTTVLLAIIFFSGIFGSLLDSFIGATLERKGIFNNNHTNFLATFLSGALSILVYILIV